MTTPTVIPLKARVVDTHIEIFWGRWHTVRYYMGKNRIPSEKIQKECIRTLSLNTGLPVTQQYKITSWEA